MILLASQVEGAFGGVPMLNQLILRAAERGSVHCSVVAFVDTPEVTWRRAWPDSSCASGRRARFVAAVMKRALTRRGATIFVSHLGLSPVGRLAKTVARGRLIVMLLGAEAVGTLPRSTRWALTKCDLLVAISAYTLTRFRQRHPQFADIPGQVCHLPARFFGVVDPPPEHRPRQLRILTVGRLWGRGMEKGQRQLITTWPRIQERFPGAELCIVGGGEGLAELERLAATLGVSSVVRFPGAVPDEELAMLYDTSDVFAMPSRHEGFGLVFAEAMSRGLPCVASRIDAGAEVVVEGKTGLLCDPDDLNEIHDAICRLLSDPELRQQMGQAARRRAEEAFSTDQFDRKIQQLLSGRMVAS